VAKAVVLNALLLVVEEGLVEAEEEGPESFERNHYKTGNHAPLQEEGAEAAAKEQLRLHLSNAKHLETNECYV